MLLYALGGRAVLDRIKRRTKGHVVERTLGVVLIVTGRGHAHQPRRPLRGGAGQGHEPAGVPRRPDPLAGELQRRAEPAGLAAAGVPVRRAAERGVADPDATAAAGRRRHPRGQDPGAAEARPGPGVHRQPALVQHPRQPAADPPGPQAATSCSWTSGPTRASTASARCRSSRACTPTTTATGWRSSASRRRSSRSSRRPPTSSRRSTPTACATRSSRTTGTGPGTRTRTSTGRPST